MSAKEAKTGLFPENLLMGLMTCGGQIYRREGFGIWGRPTHEIETGSGLYMALGEVK